MEPGDAGGACGDDGAALLGWAGVVATLWAADEDFAGLSAGAPWGGDSAL